MTTIYALLQLVYAVIIMVLLLDFNPSQLSPQKRAAAVSYAAFVLAVNGIVKYFFPQLYGSLYLFIAQIPVYIGFRLFSRYKGIKLFFVLLSTIVFSTPAIILSLTLRTYYTSSPSVLFCARLLCNTIMALLIYKFFKANFNYMLENCESRQFRAFCIIPVLGYLHTYARTGYNFNQTYAKSGFWVLMIPSIMVFTSYILLAHIFHTTREKQVLENENHLLQMMQDSAERYLEELQSKQEQTVIYRHDMRHHLSLIGLFAAENNMEKIKNYIDTAQADIDALMPKRFCENETANLILFAFHERAQKEAIVLCADVKLPNTLSVSDTELCTLLSNALENALTAVKQVENKELRRIFVRIFIKDDKLFLSTENAYNGEVKMDGGLPKSIQKEPGHGLGIKSIIKIAEHYDGMYSFSAAHQIFTFQLILPL